MSFSSANPFDKLKFHIHEFGGSTTEADEAYNYPPRQVPGQHSERTPKLAHFSYDEILHWWNSLEEAQGKAMLDAGIQLTRRNLAEFRNQYQAYYPKDYYPHRTVDEVITSVVDYYVLFHLGDDIAKKRYDWFTPALTEACSPKALLPDNESRLPSQIAFTSKQDAVSAAKSWFDNMSSDSQKAMRMSTARLRPQQISIIRETFYKLYPHPWYSCRGVPTTHYLDDLDLFLMFCYRTHFKQYIWFTAVHSSFEVGAVAIVAMAAPGRAPASVSNFFALNWLRHLTGNVARFFQPNDRNSLRERLRGFGIVLRLAVLAASGLGSAGYAVRKFDSSIFNIVHARKILSSLWRILCMVGSGAFGAVKGGFYGALLGTAILPGFGTGVGTFLGGVIGLGLFLGLGTVFGKYSAQLFHKLRTGTTNPHRYNAERALTKMRENGVGAELAQQGVALNTTLIQEVFSDIHQAKSQFKAVKGNPVKAYYAIQRDTPEHKHKELYNSFTEALVEKGMNPLAPVRISQNIVMMWNREQHQIQIQELDMPKPQRPVVGSPFPFR